MRKILNLCGSLMRHNKRVDQRETTIKKQSKQEERMCGLECLEHSRRWRVATSLPTHDHLIISLAKPSYENPRATARDRTQVLGVGGTSPTTTPLYQNKRLSSP